MTWLISGIQTALMLALSLLLNTMYREDGAENKCFLCGILCAICILIQPETLLYLPLLWVSFRVLRISTMRTFVASVLGLGIVAIYTSLAWWYWQDATWMQTIVFSYAGIFNREWIIVRPIWEVGVVAASTLLGLYFILHHMLIFTRANVHVQTRYLLLLPFFFIGAADSIYPQQEATSLWIWVAISSLSLAILYFVHFGIPRFSHKAVYSSSHHWAQKRRGMMIVLLLATLLVTSCQLVQPISPDEHPGQDTTQMMPTDTIVPSAPDTSIVTPPSPLDDTKRNLDYLFDIESLPEITITLTLEDWNQYLRNFDANKDNSIYVPAQWTFRKGDDVFHRDSVGLRPRGNTSRVRPEGSNGQMHQSNHTNWHHAHFGICFTEYESGERFFGMDRVVLKWHKEDPMYCREIYCYDLFRRFGVWSAPRASYCRLNIYIQGDRQPAYYGVYELIEGVRKGYLDDRRKEGHLPDSDGNMWKAAYGANLSDPNQSMGVNTDEQSFIYDHNQD